jgi:hypothetical protein
MTEESTIPVPQSVDELGILRSSLEQLALKLLFLASELTMDKLARQLRLRLDVVNEVFQSLRKAELCEVKGTVGGCTGSPLRSKENPAPSSSSH